MAKDTFWFKHDYDAADDEKTMILIEQLGLEGYGIYWVLIEKLRAREGYKMPFSIVPSLARRYMTTPEKMKTVIMNYGLFQYDDEGFFYSESLIRRMECYLELKEKQALKAKKAAETRWGKNKSMLEECLEHACSNPQALQEQCDSSTHAMQSNADKNRIDKSIEDKNIEEYKEKEEETSSSSKRKRTSKPFVKPTIEELEEYIKEKGYHFDAESFFAFYESKGWMIGKNPMKNWKMACVTWEKGCNKGVSLFDNHEEQNQTTNKNIVIGGIIYR